MPTSSRLPEELVHDAKAHAWVMAAQLLFWLPPARVRCFRNCVTHVVERDILAMSRES